MPKVGEFDTSDAAAPRGEAPLSMRDKLDRDIVRCMRELSSNIAQLTEATNDLFHVSLQMLEQGELSICECPCHDDDDPKGGGLSA